MAQSSQRANRSGDLLSHMFVLGKKTIDSVNCLISGTLGTSDAFSAGAWEIFFQSTGHCLGSVVWAISRTVGAPAHLEVLCHGWGPGQELRGADAPSRKSKSHRVQAFLGAGAQL